MYRNSHENTDVNPCTKGLEKVNLSLSVMIKRPEHTAMASLQQEERLEPVMIQTNQAQSLFSQVGEYLQGNILEQKHDHRGEIEQLQQLKKKKKSAKVI